MHTELRQQSGPNIRVFTLHENGIEVDARGQGTHSNKRFLFHDFGQQKTDFDITKRPQMRFPAWQRLIMAFTSLGLAATFFGISDHISQAAGGQMTVMADITVAIGWVFFALLFAVLFLQTKSLRCKRVYFQGGSLEFFFRNQRDGDQIDAFLAEYAKAESAYAKEYFLKELNKDPKGLQRWLENLYDRDVFTDAEYKRHRTTIEAAEKPLNQGE